MPKLDLVRYKEVRRADAVDDQKPAAQIANPYAPGTQTQEDLQQLILSQIKRILFGDNPGHWYDDFIAAGGQPIVNATQVENVGKVFFNYATPSPMTLQTVSPNSVLDRAVLLITTPFNAPAATLQLGTSANPG